ncbi:MAG: hypothetical protein LR015_03960 [Verrucomicrobia bacterium]|nr:hypothetical protein [Verrucomicrobiota bacterium]
MKSNFLGAACAFICLLLATASAVRAEVFAEGDRLLAEQSYGIAVTYFERLRQNTNLTADQKDKLRLKLFEARWRLAWQQQDHRRARQIVQEINDTATEVRGSARRAPDLWAFLRAEEGIAWLHLGDSRRAQLALRDAFEHWAEGTDIDSAKVQYLSLLRRSFNHPPPDDFRSLRNLPADFLEDALRISTDATDVAWIHYTLIALWRERWAHPALQLRVGDSLRSIVELGPVSEFYSSALLELAEWYSNYGNASYDAAGQLRLEPDFARSMEIYQQFLNEFGSEATEQVDLATSKIAEITRAEVAVLVSSAFRPQSEVQFVLRFRNSPQVRVRLDPIQLADAKNHTGEDFNFNHWPIPSSDPHWQQTVEVQPRLPHYPVEQTIRVADLPAGAWLVTAIAGDERQSELLLVSDLALVIQSQEADALVFAADAVTGTPSAGTEMAVLLRKMQEGVEAKESWLELRTDDQGIARFELPRNVAGVHVFAGRDTRQATARHSVWQISNASDLHERLYYVYAARPLYKGGGNCKLACDCPQSLAARTIYTRRKYRFI